MTFQDELAAYTLLYPGAAPNFRNVNEALSIIHTIMADFCMAATGPPEPAAIEEAKSHLIKLAAVLEYMHQDLNSIQTIEPTEDETL